MSELDSLNLTCAEYAKTLTNKWTFTGWKPSQNNIRLHAQWLRADDYEGERYYSSVQCLPLESINDGKRALERMKMALEDIELFTRLAPEPVKWK